MRCSTALVLVECARCDCLRRFLIKIVINSNEIKNQVLLVVSQKIYLVREVSRSPGISRCARRARGSRTSGGRNASQVGNSIDLPPLRIPAEKRIMDIPALTSRTAAFHNASVSSLNESVFV